MKTSVIISIGLFVGAMLNSCSGQNSNTNHQKQSVQPKTEETQIADYVVEIFEDGKGTLWFGTMSKGVARYDGNKLSYLTNSDGLPSNTVVSIAEAKDGSLWIATHDGLSHYNGETFETFTKEDGLPHNRISCLLFDSAGNLWVGTWGGVAIFNGRMFSEFTLPKPKVELHNYQTTMDWVTEIFEDSKGYIWIGRDGYGVAKYNGKTLRNYTKADGLLSNNVQSISEDDQGNLWFGSRPAEQDNPDPDKRTGPGGLTRFDGETFVSFPDIEGLTNGGVFSICKDKKGNMWVGSSGTGVYRYDGSNFHLYRGTNRMDLTYSIGVQSIIEDSHGHMWFGFSGGLFRLVDGKIVNVTNLGPWD